MVAYLSAIVLLFIYLFILYLIASYCYIQKAFKLATFSYSHLSVKIKTQEILNDTWNAPWEKLLCS
jgi:hypothetical protein